MQKEKKISALNDANLISAYKEDGDKKIVGELFKRYTQFVFCVCMKYLKNEEQSREAVMNIFEKLFTELHKSEIKNFKPWLYTVSKNYCLLEIRSQSYQQKYDKELEKNYSLFMESGEAMYPYNENYTEEKIRLLQDGIAKLPEEQQNCVQLFYLEEKCYQDVAEITGYTMKQVKSYIQNGKRNLKIYIKEKYEAQL